MGRLLVSQWDGERIYFSAGGLAFRDSIPGIFIRLSESLPDRGPHPHVTGVDRLTRTRDRQHISKWRELSLDDAQAWPCWTSRAGWATRG